MKYFKLYTSVVFGLLQICNTASADADADADENDSSSILWVGSSSLVYKDLDFEQINLNDNSKFSANPNFLMLNLSLTAAYKKFYMSVNYDLGLRDYEESGNKIYADSQQEDYIYSRTDYNLTAGYNITKSFSVFGGYLFGETKIDYTVINQAGVVRLRATDYYRENGLFVGVNYSVPANNIGIFSFNLAYALLDSEYERNVHETINNVQSGSLFGDTTGISYGIKFTRAYSKSFYYHFGLKANNYEFKPNNGLTTAKENYIIASAGVSVVF